MTGSLNAGELMALEAQMDLRARSTNPPGSYGLVLVDVDGLRHINTRCGAEVGDAVLVELARRLVRESPDASVARVDGDKFAVLVGGLGPREVAHLGHRLEFVLNAAPWSIGGGDVAVHVRTTALAGPSSHAGETHLLWVAQRAQRLKAQRELEQRVTDLENQMKLTGLQAEYDQFRSRIAIAIARHDSLTGLLNRQGYVDVLSRLEAPYALAFLDLDNLRVLNKTPGLLWSAGDQALVSVARLLERLSAEVTVIRWGGDEFLVFLPGFSAPDAVRAIESLLRESADELLVGELPVTLSGGVASVSSTEEHLAAMDRAEQLTLEAKAGGRSQIKS
jgi:diguanylate cyclase (GGDEF)-like protein